MLGHCTRVRLDKSLALQVLYRELHCEHLCCRLVDQWFDSAALHTGLLASLKDDMHETSALT